MPSKKTKSTTTSKKIARPVVQATPAKKPARKTAKKKQSLTPAPLPISRTHVFLLVDESSSMASIAGSANKALKQWAADIRASSAAAGQSTIINVTYFNTSIRDAVRELDVNLLTEQQLNIVPNGCTALYLALYQAAAAGRRILRDNKDDSVLVVLFTDGEDTASQGYHATAKNEVAFLLNTGHADVAMMVPPRTADSIARRTGIDRSNIREWEATDEGVQQTTRTFNSSFNNYYAARSAGATSLQSSHMSFYVDPDDLTKKDLGKLNDISKDIKLLPVTHRDPERVDEFFAAHFNRPFEKGKLFYELTKSEKLQPYKSIIVQDLETGKAFSGNDARSMLGLAFTGEVRVRPGNDKKKRVFVQSTSVNRKLVTGTEVVFWEKA